MESGAAEGREEGRGQASSQWSRSGFRAGRARQLCPRQGSPAVRPQRGSLTYTAASSRASSWSPAPPGRRGPHTSSSRCCRGTGRARSGRVRHTRGRRARAAGAAGSPPPQGCVPAQAGIGSSPLLSERGAKGGSSVQVPKPNSEPGELPGHRPILFY